MMIINIIHYHMHALDKSSYREDMAEMVTDNPHACDTSQASILIICAQVVMAGRAQGPTLMSVAMLWKRFLRLYHSPWNCPWSSSASIETSVLTNSLSTEVLLLPLAVGSEVTARLRAATSSGAIAR